MFYTNERLMQGIEQGIAQVGLSTDWGSEESLTMVAVHGMLMEVATRIGVNLQGHEALAKRGVTVKDVTGIDFSQ